MKAALGLTLAVAGIYLLTASGHLFGQDQEYYYRMARAIAREHGFAIEPLVFQGTELAGKRGRSGNFYAEYAPALPVAMAPLIVLADLAQSSAAGFESNYRWQRDRSDDVIERIFLSYFDIPVVAATAGLLVLLVRRLGYPPGAGLFIGATFALSTLAWGQSRITNPEPLQGLLLVAAVLLTVGATTKRAFAGGLAIGLAVLVKLTSVLALPAILLLPNYGKAPLSVKLRIFIALLLPLIGGFAVYAWYNHARFGNLLATGYNASGRAAELGGNGIGNPIIGLFGLLLSTGRGVVWYAPPVLAGAAGFLKFYREKKRMAIAFALAVGIWFALHACYQGWDSGWGWGPRYCLPILPLMLVPAAELLRRRRGKILCVTLAILGFLVQLPGALVDFMASGRAGMTMYGQSGGQHSMAAFVAWQNFHLAGSEIVRNLALLREGQVDLAWLTFRGTSLPIITIALAAILLATGALLMVSEFYSAAKAKTSSAQPHERVNPEPPCP